MLKEIQSGLYTFDFDCPIGPGMSFPARSTLIQQDDGKLFIISPGPFDEETYKQIESLSDRVILISPNMMHHMFIEQSFERWPKVEIYGNLNLWKQKKHPWYQPYLNQPTKQPWLKPYLKDIRTVHEVLSTDTKAMLVRGNSLIAETVFYDSKRKTLIVTDLVFNMDDTVGFLAGLTLRMAGVYNKLGQSRIVKFTTKNKMSYKTSVEKILEFDFERIIPAHGNIIEDADAFRAVLQKTIR